MHVLKAGPWWEWAPVFVSFCLGGLRQRSTKLYFVLSVPLTPDPPAFQRLTSIAACSESGRIQRQPIHPWLRADWRPSVRRSEPTLTSADSPKNVRQETTLQQWHGNAKTTEKKINKKIPIHFTVRKKIRRNSALTLFYTWWTHQYQSFTERKSISIPDPCSTEPAGQAAWRTFPEWASFLQASRHSVVPSSSAPCP